MTSTIDSKGPAVKCPPPLIFIGCLAAGFGVQQILPVTLGLALWGKLIGTAVFSYAAVMLLLLLSRYVRAKTHIEPWKPTTTLLTSGLYAHTRNPIYLMFCLLNIGVGLYFNSLWVTLSFIPSAWLVYHVAIRKEEAYLLRKFGTRYSEYKNSTRRWL